MTCGDPITEEQLHEYVMAASYWKQQSDKKDDFINKLKENKEIFECIFNDFDANIHCEDSYEFGKWLLEELSR